MYFQNCHHARLNFKVVWITWIPSFLTALPRMKEPWLQLSNIVYIGGYHFVVISMFYLDRNNAHDDNFWSWFCSCACTFHIIVQRGIITFEISTITIILTTIWLALHYFWDVPMQRSWVIPLATWTSELLCASPCIIWVCHCLEASITVLLLHKKLKDYLCYKTITS